MHACICTYARVVLKFTTRYFRVPLEPELNLRVRMHTPVFAHMQCMDGKGFLFQGFYHHSQLFNAKVSEAMGFYHHSQTINAKVSYSSMSRAEQSRAEQSRTEQSRTDQDRKLELGNFATQSPIIFPKYSTPCPFSSLIFSSLFCYFVTESGAN